MNLLKKIIPKSLKQLIKDKLGVPDMFASFKQIEKLGYNPDLIIDVGAYEGAWTLEMAKIFPNSKFLMFEGQLEKESKLKAISHSLKNCTYKMNLLGAEKKQVMFNKYDTASSILNENNITNAIKEERTLCTLDESVDTEFKNKSILLKIDTQGYEIEVLKGAKRILEITDMVLLEVSMLNIYLDAPLVDEVMLFMKNNGFLLYDICSILRRPLDNALYQSDFIFVKPQVLGRDNTRWN